MISLKCDNCGAEMSVDSRGGIVCPYCGSNNHLSDFEFEEYKKFRLNLLNYLKSTSDMNNDSDDGTFLWENSERISFQTSDGMVINIDYLFYSEENSIKTYVAKESVILVFPSEKSIDYINFKRHLGDITYPSADIKNLSKYFPIVKGQFTLDDNRVLLVLNKPQNAYPLFAFGTIKPVHAAWVVSRLENLCCVLEFSGLINGGISLNSVYINPKTHEAYLLGGWSNSKIKNTSNGTDLIDIRKTIKKLISGYESIAPQEFIDFLNETPQVDAYTDFERWDMVIEKGFGGHRFTNFNRGE